MDDMEFLVAETFKHLHETFQVQQEERNEVQAPLNDFMKSYPEGPGVIYHVQKTIAVFVIRTLVSKNIREDYLKILERPEDYPSLRLTDMSGAIQDGLRFFMVENSSEAEIIHDQLHNRRFPFHEEMMCNLSDPGFSWWLTKKPEGFQLSFTMSISDQDENLKLGPLGDRELAIRRFQGFENLVASAGIGMNIQNEMNRVQFTDCEEFIREELKDLFEFGVVTQTLKDLFKILAKKTSDHSLLEEIWFYLNELAAMRRFWIQIQYDLTSGIENQS
jgi:hypothetical protein